MDLIIAVGRALANKSRLRLLRSIHQQPGRTVQVLAQDVRLSVTAVSKHLKLLRGLQLIQTAPSGRFVQCVPAQKGSTGNAFLADIQKLMAELFVADELNRTLAQVCDSNGRTWDDVYAAMIKHATIFTHLRRLLLLRLLARGKTSRPEEMAASVGMSADAVRRHLDKLCRRGVVTNAPGVSGAWTISRRIKPPCRQKLLAIVLRAIKAV